MRRGLAGREDVEPVEVNLFDPDVVECPYPTYATLRDEAPVWHDPATGMYVVTRHDDVRSVLLDPATFSSRVQGRPRSETLAAEARARLMRERFENHGWVPGATLAGRDDPEHKQMRALFDHAFRPSRMKQLDPHIAEVAHGLIDGFVADDPCDWVAQFAVALPLIVIGTQMGVPAADIWRIKAWTDAWVQVLRLEGPVQGLFRVTTTEVELGGTTIPAGAIVNVRYAAANRDERCFERADAIDLARDRPRAHVAFGLGTHYCLGAPLARRELLIGFGAALARFDHVALIDGANDLRHQPNFCLRALRELHITFSSR